jgi:predicted RNase H-like HicB family nuclease
VPREPPPLIAYAANITRERRYWLADFPECPGCQTFALSEHELRRVAEEALAGWLEAQIAVGAAPPTPAPVAAGQFVWAVPVEAVLAAKLRRIWSGQPFGVQV